MYLARPAKDRTLLNAFNHRLRTLMRHVGMNDSSAQGGDAGAEGQLRAIFRRTFLAEWIADRYLIAVAGVQGAGKTTLLQQLYDLPEDGFLAPNAGRGERLPILVTEAEIKAPKGLAWRLQGAQGGFGLQVEDGLTVEAFQLLARGKDERVLMLEVQVPFRHFNRPNTGFMLLPGFEPGDRVSEDWQALVRDALALATTCVFVTDPTLWASRENLEEAKAAFQTTFKEGAPILVLTRADMRDPEREEALRLSLAQSLGLGDARRVVSAGVELTGGKAWRGPFLEAIERYQADSRGLRTAQVRLFQTILKRDLNAAFQSCSALIGDLVAKRDEHRFRVQEILEIYDRSARSLKDVVARRLYEDLQVHANAQSDKLRDAITDRDLLHQVSGFLFGESLADVRAAEMELTKAWVGSGGHSARACLVHALTEAAQNRLFLFPSAQLPTLDSGAYGKPLATLGYSQSTDLPVHSAGEAPFLAPEFNLGQQIQTLMNPSEAGADPEQGEVFEAATLESAVKALPLLAGELMRLAAFEPAWFKVKITAADDRALDATVEGFKALHGHKKELLAGMGSMLGVQGTCDSIPALVRGFGMLSRGTLLAGGTAALEGAAVGGGAVAGSALAGEAAAGSAVAGTTAATVAGVAAAVGVAGALAVAVMRVHFGREKDEATRIEACLSALVDHQMHDYLSRLEELLSLFRERLENALSARYHLHKVLGRNVNLEIALANMKETRREMLEELHDFETSLGLLP